ncbi:protein MIZU-KUSSEI 1 [Corylus avellana]|uniref:protein MIZU-KUSSEI 1 n=1 Tax=Corylus avellana TaxID=13451 RepID=UPI001E20902F|nr:protein MIZU-KUSSEI 1 [Corylus avellana]
MVVPQQPESSPRSRPPPSPQPEASPQTPARRPPISLQPSHKHNPSKSSRLLRRFRSVFQSFPIVNIPSCKIPISLHGSRLHDGHIHGGKRMTGTLFGFRKARVNLAIQETPRSLPILLLELAIPTGKLLQDMGMGLVRIALECEKHPSDKTKIIDEPIWSLYCNGRKSGYAVKREPTDDDLSVMQMLHAVSMGAGVLPSDVTSDDHQGHGGELMYMRAHFERVVGSKDSETYYMMNPDGNSGPELSIFFVRI